MGRQLLDRRLFVYLYRKDLLQQEVSTDFFDVSALDQTLHDPAEADRGWREFLARNGTTPISVSHERLCEDPAAAVAAIAPQAGIDPETLNLDGREERAPMPDSGTMPGRAELIRHCLAATRQIHGAAPAPITKASD